MRIEAGDLPRYRVGDPRSAHLEVGKGAELARDLAGTFEADAASVEIEELELTEQTGFAELGDDLVRTVVIAEDELSEVGPELGGHRAEARMDRLHVRQREPAQRCALHEQAVAAERDVD